MSDEDDTRDAEFVAMKHRERDLQARLDALHQSVTAAIDDIGDALELLDKTLRELKAARHMPGRKRGE